MKLQKAMNRDKKIHNKKNGMRVDNRGINLLAEQMNKRADKIKAKNKKKNKKIKDSSNE